MLPGKYSEASYRFRKNEVITDDSIFNGPTTKSFYDIKQYTTETFEVDPA